MAEMTHEDIERIWNAFTHYLPDRTKTDAAVDFINTLKDLDVEQDEIIASSDYDPKLEEAVQSVFPDDDSDSEDEYNTYGDE